MTDDEKRLKNILAGMKQRCNNPKHTAARWYHDKGIRVCREWELNPYSFVHWALTNGYKPGLAIDRIDSNRGYSPDNCRWLTRSENSRRAKRTSITVPELRKLARERGMTVDALVRALPPYWLIEAGVDGLESENYEVLLFEQSLCRWFRLSYAEMKEMIGPVFDIDDSFKEAEKKARKLNRDSLLREDFQFNWYVVRPDEIPPIQN